jgi:DNA-binding transcriptional LysR family regulator
MNLTLRQLRAFVQVARHGGFTAAARHLHLTQSATSLLVRELEGQLGVQLLDRTTRQVSITDAGSEFLQSAERILADVDHAVTNTLGLVEKRRGRIAVATTPLFAATLLPEVIAQFRQTYPAITVRLADLLTEQIVRQVQSGEADFGIGTFLGLDAEIDRVALFHDKLGVLLTSGSPLASRRRLNWADLAGQPLIAMSHASAFRPLIDQALQRAGISLAPRFEVGYMGTAIGLVEAGLGVSVLPAYTGSLVRSDKVRFRVLQNPVVTREVTLVRRAGRSLSPAATAFRDCLAAHCARMRRLSHS